VEVETTIQEDSAMPDVQISPTVETRDYLNITETADRSRLAVKTLYNWISLGRLGPREGVCHVGRKVVIHWPTFEAAVMRRGVNGAA
jgi:hypothetical protein